MRTELLKGQCKKATSVLLATGAHYSILVERCGHGRTESETGKIRKFDIN